jgi:iron complex outermembrane receptor protein
MFMMALYGLKGSRTRQNTLEDFVKNHFERCGMVLVGAVLPICFSMSSISLAQQPVGSSITGTVLDTRGRAVQGASVIVKDNNSNNTVKVTTNDQGRFSITNLAPSSYDATITAPGFSAVVKTGIAVSVMQSQDVSVSLKIGSLSQDVVVQAIAGNSIAAQHALSQGSLDTEAPKSEIGSLYIQDFNPPTADYSEIIKIAPGTFSYNSNGVGLGDGTVYFRGFIDGDYDVTWDGIPYNDTNNPTHHTWAFFPGVWIGGVDFDRSPGTASTIGPATYGGSINLLSKEVPSQQSAMPSVSYGSFNTLLIDGNYNTGLVKPNNKLGVSMDVHRMTSDGFQTFNNQIRNAGDIKILYSVSDRTTITGYSGVVDLNSHTPNNNPYRAQVNTYGWNYLLENNDPTSAFYQKYNYYHVPTDFEYIGYRSELNHGWLLEAKPYTYSYNNAQHYANDTGNDTTGLATGADSSTGYITEATCSTPVVHSSYTALPCAIDKLNSYRKYGETATASQNSKYGIFRTGIWYEWSKTNRYQYPQDPISGVDQALGNFHERFWINSYNPFAEYEWHATPKLTITAGDKFAYYTMNLTQYADDGKTVGNLNGAPSVSSSGGFPSNLPSAEANYHLTKSWAAYGQFGKGAQIPPSSIFDVAGGGAQVGTLPKPEQTTTYQGGTVIKLNRFTLDADAYRIKFQNNYIALAVANPNNPNYDLNQYYLGPDSVTKGFEAETNASLGYGFNVYANGTVGKATYVGAGVPSNQYVADTPAYTQSLGVTYQAHQLDLGVIEQRIGDHYNDNGTYHNQAYVAPFNNLNLFFNYTLHNHSIFNQSKISLGINNLLNDESVLDVAQSNSPVAIGNSEYLATTAPSPLDQLALTAGRSFMFSFKLGIFPNKEK